MALNIKQFAENVAPVLTFTEPKKGQNITLANPTIEGGGYVNDIQLGNGNELLRVPFNIEVNPDAKNKKMSISFSIEDPKQEQLFSIIDKKTLEWIKKYDLCPNMTEAEMRKFCMKTALKQPKDLDKGYAPTFSAAMYAEGTNAVQVWELKEKGDSLRASRVEDVEDFLCASSKDYAFKATARLRIGWAWHNSGTKKFGVTFVVKKLYVKREARRKESHPPGILGIEMDELESKEEAGSVVLQKKRTSGDDDGNENPAKRSKMSTSSAEKADDYLRRIESINAPEPSFT